MTKKPDHEPWCNDQDYPGRVHSQNAYWSCLVFAHVGSSSSVNIIPAREVTLVVARNVAANLTNEVQIDNPLLAPIAAGQKVGQIIVKNGDQVVYTVDAVAQTEVSRGGFFSVLWDTLSLFFGGLFGMKV